jgi:hypothetical protein
MSKLTRREDITKRLCASYDKGWYASIYRQMCYAFGEGQDSLPGGEGRFPDFPDVTPSYKEVGTSRRILNTQFITLTRVMYSDPEPEFPDVDKMTGQVRQKFYRARSRGDGYGEGEWDKEFCAAFMDGDGLGTGVVQVGLRTNPLTGYQRVSVRHVPLLQTLWDRSERSIGDARMVAFMDYVPVDVAEARYGPKFVQENLHIMEDPETDDPIECVRLFEYWDTGFGKGQPTRAVIRRPVGRIPLLMAGQEAINNVERRMLREVQNAGGTFVFSERVDPADMAKFKRGEGGKFEATKPLMPGEVVAEVVPGGEVSNTTLAYLQMLEADFTANAGVTEFDRGSNPEESRTLGENLLVDERSKVQSAWSALQAAKFHQRVAEMVCKIAKAGDTDPVDITLDGVTATLNDPEDSRMAVSYWLEEPSRAIVSVESLAKNDLQREMAMEQQRLAGLADLLQMGVIDPLWYAKERVKAAGYDPDEAIQQQPVADPMMDPMSQGMDPMAQPQI